MPEAQSSMLHCYRLRSKDTIRLPARSNQHRHAFVRMHKDDVKALSEGADSLRTMIVLFSTASAQDPVFVDVADIVHVRLNKNDQWLPLRVMGSHAYVRGMKISGFIHRAVLRLVYE